MKSTGYSLVEVLVAAAIVAVGLTAAAMLVGTLMQQELNAAALRAANVQEQAVKLHRLDLGSSSIRSLIPEPCVASGSPPVGGYTLLFSDESVTNIVVDGTTIDLSRTSVTLIYPNTLAAGNITNKVDVFRPSTRVKYDQ